MPLPHTIYIVHNDKLHVRYIKANCIAEFCKQNLRVQFIILLQIKNAPLRGALVIRESEPAVRQQFSVQFVILMRTA